MKISAGIMAYNEERNIAATIESLARQTIFSDPAVAVVVHVVANGCRDQTAARAREAMEKFFDPHVRTRCEVNEIVEAGKANAWNRFVHEFSDGDADALLLLDADIVFGQPECLERVVEALRENPSAVVAVDLPLKDITARQNPNLREQMSIAASQLQTAGAPKIAGSLYLAKTEALRAFWMPLGLIVEDGFVKAMLLTDCFRKDEDLGKIVRASNATHYFEAVSGFSAWFKHERRLVNGTAVNILLFRWLRSLVEAGEDPGENIRLKNLQNPAWVSHLASQWKGPLPGAWQFVSEPLKKLLRQSPGKWPVMLPIAAIRSLLNVAVCAVCQMDIRAGRLRW